MKKAKMSFVWVESYSFCSAFGWHRVYKQPNVDLHSRKISRKNNIKIVKFCMEVRKLRCGKVYRDRSVRAGKVRMT